jgi:hypothetical protein
MGRSYYTTATPGSAASGYEWSGKRRFKSKYARSKYGYQIHRGSKAMKRKTDVERTLFKSSLKAWKGNEWAQKALNEAWDKDTRGYRTMHTAYKRGRIDMTNTGGEGGHEEGRKIPGGYSGFSDTGINQFGHHIAKRAQQMHEEHIRGEESAKRISGRKARGGMGARGSTIMTGGHKGVLDEAKTKKTTLIGA